MATPVDADALRAICLFRDFQPADLEQVSRIAGVREYRKGRIIFFEGEPREAVYFIHRGKVKISKTSADGREQILHIFGPGQIFGWVAFFGDGTMPATAEAMEDSLIGYIRRPDFEKFMHMFPNLGMKILEIVGERLKAAHGQIRDLALKNTHGRVASILLNLAEEHGISQKQGTRIQLSLTHQDLASWAGTSRETVSRILSDFRREGAVEMDRRGILIRNSDRLREWLDA